MNKITVNLVLGFSIASIGTALRAADQPAATNAAAPVEAGATNSAAPKIVFATPVYDFGKVKSGDPVKYTYAFTNTGDATLTLSDVHPSCGCTTAGDWTRQVEPGKTGAIPVQFNSAAYGGSVFKTITVTSNDKSQPTVTLQLKGTIWKPVDVNPMFAMINVPPDYPPNNSATVHIVSNEEQPLTLSAPESNNKAFTAEVKTNQPGKDFQLVIMATLAPDSGNAQGQISVKTSSTNVPVINLTAWANVQPLVTLIPQQVMLPSGPTTEGQTAAVTIQNNSTNALLLSDPSVDAKDVKVDIKETQAPGKAYTATLTFPAGFEIAQGTKTELSIKTSSQRTPVIKIPVLQMPHPQSPVITPITPVPAPPGKTPTLSGKPVTQ